MGWHPKMMSRELASMPAAEWVARVSSIAGRDLRAQAASIAWWDYQVPELLPILAEYRKGYVAPVERLASALQVLGYEPAVARARAEPIDYDDAARMRKLRRERRKAAE